MNPPVSLRLIDGRLTLFRGGSLFIDEMHFGSFALGRAGSSSTLRASPWEASTGQDTGEARCVLYRSGESPRDPVAKVRVTVDGSAARTSVDVVREITGLAIADSFESSAVALPGFAFPEGLSTFLITFGLGPSGDGEIGGYWPEALIGHGKSALPSQAFSPLILYDGEKALAVAPSSQFLTSHLLATESGVSRCLHGSIDMLTPGMHIETLFVAGDTVASAMMALGDLLLTAGDKRRPHPSERIFTSTLGWWNAYGGYYTEPVHPLNARSLSEVVESFHKAEIPVKYLGLDLWYPYKVIGQALCFEPDREKYPDGLRQLSEQCDKPLALHLSALAAENEYGSPGWDSSIYSSIVTGLKQEGAVVAWHDWLRTQQHLTPELRSEPAVADHWFQVIGESLQEGGLDLLLCMQTMGMVLASTRMKSAIAARSAIDYLFGQPQALATLESLGHGGFRKDAISIAALRRQNLLVGFVLYCMGLLPFHDLFLTTYGAEMGGADAPTEAVLRALSCGPVGIGDGPGKTDRALVRSLVSSDDVLLQPDHPPFPETESLGRPVEVYRTEHVADGIRWTYLLALNGTDARQAFAVPMAEEGALLWDIFSRRPARRIAGELEPGQIAYFLLAPLHLGISPIGFIDKWVPAPADLLRGAGIGKGWRIALHPTEDTFAFWAPSGIEVADQNGKGRPIRRDGDLALVDLDRGVSVLHASGGDA